MYLCRTIFNGERRTCPFIRFHAHEYIQSRETVGLLCMLNMMYVFPEGKREIGDALRWTHVRPRFSDDSRSRVSRATYLNNVHAVKTVIRENR